MQTAILVPISEFYTDHDMKDIIRRIRKVAEHYRKLLPRRLKEEASNPSG